MRKSTVYLVFTLATIIAFCGLIFIYPLSARRHHQDALNEANQLVQRLNITDLCLFTEARYTRHLSQTDLFSPFQDHPGALEHFPSGSIVKPPTFLFESQAEKIKAGMETGKENDNETSGLK